MVGTWKMTEYAGNAPDSAKESIRNFPWRKTIVWAGPGIACSDRHRPRIVIVTWDGTRIQELNRMVRKSFRHFFTCGPGITQFRGSHIFNGSTPSKMAVHPCAAPRVARKVAYHHPASAGAERSKIDVRQCRYGSFTVRDQKGAGAAVFSSIPNALGAFGMAARRNRRYESRKGSFGVIEAAQALTVRGAGTGAVAAAPHERPRSTNSFNGKGGPSRSP